MFNSHSLWCIFFYFLLQAKDLTSSLLNNMTSLNSLSLANTARPAPVQSSTISGFPSSSPMMGSMGGPVSNGFNTQMGFSAGGIGMAMRPPGPSLYGGMATTTSTPNFGALTQHQGPSKDLSALDNLFSPSQPKVTLNQMGPKSTQGTNAAWLQQYGPAHNSQTQMQGASLGAGGVPGGFGMQANPFFSPQNFPQGTPAAAGGAVPSLHQSGVKQSASVNNDLKDLFG